MLHARHILATLLFYLLFAGMWRHLVSVITTLYYVAKIILHRRAWYRVLSLRYACIRSSGIILIP